MPCKKGLIFAEFLLYHSTRIAKAGPGFEDWSREILVVLTVLSLFRCLVILNYFNFPIKSEFERKVFCIFFGNQNQFSHLKPKNGYRITLG